MLVRLVFFILAKNSEFANLRRDPTRFENLV